MLSNTILIIGKVNVGKSTLFNKLLTTKISITSNKRNTTQKNIFGIQTQKNIQNVYIDTIGFKNILSIKNYILKKKYLKIKKYELKKINVILFVLEKNQIIKHFKNINKIIKFQKKIPIIIVINKIDYITNKHSLLPVIKKIKILSHINIIPISAKKKENIKNLKKIIDTYACKVKNHNFNKYQKTNLSIQEQIINIIKEKFFRNFYKELPYSNNIKIKSFKLNKKKEYIIKVNVFIRKKSQKKIFIGKNGKKIKVCSIQAKKNIKKILKKKVHLFLTIKQKK
ncbi:GTPase Era [Buchnera aphidicola]|uniref:GTPase Era n=1 Tax=Buchnera aphidicola TaxID=9 RepID=UPI003464639E